MTRDRIQRLVPITGTAGGDQSSAVVVAGSIAERRSSCGTPSRAESRALTGSQAVHSEGGR